MVTALETRLKHVGGMAEEHGRYLAQVYLLWLYLLWPLPRAGILAMAVPTKPNPNPDPNPNPNQIGEALFAKNAVAHRFRTAAVVPSFAPPPPGSGAAVRAGAAVVVDPTAAAPAHFGASATGGLVRVS